jgi:phage-related minor tail protein
MADFLGGVFTGGVKAKGDAFEHGSVIPFAAGGVVGGPTAFAMAGGRMGLMGEAGAEAIMPLRRGANGKLGVMGTVPRVEIHNNLGVEANARVDASGDRMRIVLEAAQLGASMAESRVNRSLRSGYGATAQSVQRTYGLRRR